MATKSKKQEDIQTLDAVDEAATETTEESKVENSGDTGENEDGNTEAATSVDGNTITLDDDGDIKPLAADDYVENFEIGGKTYAVRDVEAQDSITELNSELAYYLYDTSGITYDSTYLSDLTFNAYRIGNLAIVTGRVTPVQTTWLASGTGSVGNLPFTPRTLGGFFPTSTITNTSRGMYIRSTGSDPFYFYGTPEGGSEYAFLVILPVA